MISVRELVSCPVPVEVGHIVLFRFERDFSVWARVVNGVIRSYCVTANDVIYMGNSPDICAPMVPAEGSVWFKSQQVAWACRIGGAA